MSQMDETSVPSPDPWTWYVFNDSTLQMVNEPELHSTQSHDEALLEACHWLLDEADRVDNERDAELLDAAAQDLNVGKEFVKIEGRFDWSVYVANVKTLADIR